MSLNKLLSLSVLSFLVGKTRMLILLLENCLQGLSEIIIHTQWPGFSCSLLFLMMLWLQGGKFQCKEEISK